MKASPPPPKNVELHSLDLALLQANAGGAAVRLSHRYVAGRQLPDKAVSVLDTACAKLSLGQNSTPAAIEDLQRRLNRAQAINTDHSTRLAKIAAEEAESKEKLVPKMRELRGQIEETAEQADATEKLGPMRAELEVLNGQDPFVAVCLDAQQVSELGRHPRWRLHARRPLRRR